MPVSKNRVYLDKDGKATTDAASGEVLLVGAGGQVSQELVDKHSLETVEGDEARDLTMAGQAAKRAAAIPSQPVSFSKPDNTVQADSASAVVSPKVDETQGDDSPAKGKVFGDGAPEGGTKKASKKAGK
jgi:hypothetical protein